MTRFAYWFVPTLLAAVAAARMAVWLQQIGIATLVLFPLVVGAAIGALAGYLAVQADEASRQRLAAGLVAAGMLTSAAMHGFFYFDYRLRFEANIEGNAKLNAVAAAHPERLHPLNFVEFMEAEAPGKWPLWIMHAGAMIAGTFAAGRWTFLRSKHQAQAMASATPEA